MIVEPCRGSTQARVLVRVPATLSRVPAANRSSSSRAELNATAMKSRDITKIPVQMSDTALVFGSGSARGLPKPKAATSPGWDHRGGYPACHLRCYSFRIQLEPLAKTSRLSFVSDSRASETQRARCLEDVAFASVDGSPPSRMMAVSPVTSGVQHRVVCGILEAIPIPSRSSTENLRGVRRFGHPLKCNPRP